MACDWMRLRTSSARLVVVLIVVVGLLCLIVTLKTGRGEWNGGMENVGERELNLLSESLTKITEFHDCGTKFELDRIFSFFFHIEGAGQACTSPKPSF